MYCNLECAGRISDVRDLLMLVTRHKEQHREHSQFVAREFAALELRRGHKADDTPARTRSPHSAHCCHGTRTEECSIACELI